MHEVSGGGEAGLAASSLFAAGLFARMAGAVLWCATGDDVFAPGLACAGLHPDRVFHARAPDEKTVLLLMEEALRHPGLGGVLGELSLLPMTASRRLVLAAERSGVMAVVLRRRREGRPENTAPNAAATRWRITPVASQPLPCPGIGRARWRVELVRCRGGVPAEWTMEACDAQGVVSLPAGLADGSAAPEWGAGRRVA